MSTPDAETAPQTEPSHSLEPSEPSEPPEAAPPDPTEPSQPDDGPQLAPDPAPPSSPPSTAPTEATPPDPAPSTPSPPRNAAPPQIVTTSPPAATPSTEASAVFSKFCLRFLGKLAVRSLHRMKAVKRCVAPGHVPRSGLCDVDAAPDTTGLHGDCVELDWQPRAKVDAQWREVGRLLATIHHHTTPDSGGGDDRRLGALGTAFLQWTRDCGRVLEDVTVTPSVASATGNLDDETGELDTVLGFVRWTTPDVEMKLLRPGRFDQHSGFERVCRVAKPVAGVALVLNRVYTNECAAEWRAFVADPLPMSARACLQRLRDLAELDERAKLAALTRAKARIRRDAQIQWEGWLRVKDEGRVKLPPSVDPKLLETFQKKPVPFQYTLHQDDPEDSDDSLPPPRRVSQPDMNSGRLAVMSGRTVAWAVRSRNPHNPWEDKDRTHQFFSTLVRMQKQQQDEAEERADAARRRFDQWLAEKAHQDAAKRLLGRLQPSSDQVMEAVGDALHCVSATFRDDWVRWCGPARPTGVSASAFRKRLLRVWSHFCGPIQAPTAVALRRRESAKELVRAHTATLEQLLSGTADHGASMAVIHDAQATLAAATEAVKRTGVMSSCSFLDGYSTDSDAPRPVRSVPVLDAVSGSPDPDVECTATLAAGDVVWVDGPRGWMDVVEVDLLSKSVHVRTSVRVQRKHPHRPFPYTLVPPPSEKQPSTNFSGLYGDEEGDGEETKDAGGDDHRPLPHVALWLPVGHLVRARSTVVRGKSLGVAGTPPVLFAVPAPDPAWGMALLHTARKTQQTEAAARSAAVADAALAASASRIRRALNLGYRARDRGRLAWQALQVLSRLAPHRAAEFDSWQSVGATLYLVAPLRIAGVVAEPLEELSLNMMMEWVRWTEASGGWDHMQAKGSSLDDLWALSVRHWRGFGGDAVDRDAADTRRTLQHHQRRMRRRQLKKRKPQQPGQQAASSAGAHLPGIPEHDASTDGAVPGGLGTPRVSSEDQAKSWRMAKEAMDVLAGWCSEDRLAGTAAGVEATIRVTCDVETVWQPGTEPGSVSLAFGLDDTVVGYIREPWWVVQLRSADDTFVTVHSGPQDGCRVEGLAPASAVSIRVICVDVSVVAEGDNPSVVVSSLVGDGVPVPRLHYRPCTVRTRLGDTLTSPGRRADESTDTGLLDLPWYTGQVLVPPSAPPPPGVVRVEEAVERRWLELSWEAPEELQALTAVRTAAGTSFVVQCRVVPSRPPPGDGVSRSDVTVDGTNTWWPTNPTDPKPIVCHLPFSPSSSSSASSPSPHHPGLARASTTTSSWFSSRRLKFELRPPATAPDGVSLFRPDTFTTVYQGRQRVCGVGWFPAGCTIVFRVACQMADAPLGPWSPDTVVNVPSSRLPPPRVHTVTATSVTLRWRHGLGAGGMDVARRSMRVTRSLDVTARTRHTQSPELLPPTTKSLDRSAFPPDPQSRWFPHLHPEHGETYWYQPSTRRASWNPMADDDDDAVLVPEHAVWVEVWDVRYERCYFVNKHTGEAVWEVGAEIGCCSTPAPAPSGETGGTLYWTAREGDTGEEAKAETNDAGRPLVEADDDVSVMPVATVSFQRQTPPSARYHIVYRSADQAKLSGWEGVGTTGTVPGLQPNTHYVLHVGSKDLGLRTRSVGVWTAPLPPRKLAAPTVSATAIDLEWQPPTYGAAHYRVQVFRHTVRHSATTTTTTDDDGGDDAKPEHTAVYRGTTTRARVAGLLHTASYKVYVWSVCTGGVDSAEPAELTVTMRRRRIWSGYQ